MRKLRLFVIIVSLLLGIQHSMSSQCLTCNTQDPGLVISGAGINGIESTVGTWQEITTNFNGNDYAVFNLTHGYTYEWQVCGNTGFTTPMLSLFSGSTCSEQEFIYSNSGACSTISLISSANQTISILLSETNCNANSTNLTLKWRSTCRPPSSTKAITDHGGADWIISADVFVDGDHININNFIINAGITATLSTSDFHVEAVNITINGTIDGDFKGAVGGTGGTGGAASSGSDGSCNSGGIGLAGGDGNGTGPGFAGGDGLLGGCTALNCIACSNGYIAGSGGAGSGGGAAHFADGGTSGSGAQAADVNDTDALGGFGGNGPFFGSFAYGDNTSESVLPGSGGAGGGGGGGGYTPGSNAGDGGAGGGQVELIATNTVNISATGAIYCNGFDGSSGGNGGYGSLDNVYECFDDGDLESTDNCGACPAIGNYFGSGGAGGGAGGGSGGGILISSADLATILGTLEVSGGEGGDAGFPNTTYGTCFRNARGGSGGVGGRIKIFRNPCLENQINPSSDVTGGLPGIAIGGSLERAASGVQLLIDHPSYVAFDAGTIQTDQDICADGLPDPIITGTAPSGGIGTYTYQWWRCSVGDCTNPPVGYTPIGGQTGATYTPPTLTGTTYYSLMVQSGSEECREWTSPVIVTVHPDPSISINADQNDVCLGQPITLTATVIGGHGSCTIQWQYSDDGTIWNNVGTNSTTYAVPTGTSVTNRQYRATYECTSDGCDIDISNIEIINVADPPTWDVITVTPLEICLSGEVTFLATVVDGLGGTIEWFISPAGAGTWTTVTSPDNPAIGSWDYQPVYTPGGTGCAIADAPINTVVVVEDPIISISATETEHCEDDPLTLSATASGGSGTCAYQWQYWDGATWVNVGTDSDTYAIPADVTFVDVRYRALYTCDGEGCNQATSNELLITIFENPTVTASANPNPQCSAEPVDLSATGNGGLAPYTFDWDNGLGAGQNHTVNPASNTTYTVTLTDDNGCTAEGSVDVVVNELPTVTATANPNPQCEGLPVDLSATGANGTSPYTYDWDNGLGVGQNHTVTPLVNTTYTVTVSDDNGCTAENTVDVVINEPPTLTVTANPNPQCASEPVDLSASASGGTSPYTYAWDNGLGAGANHTVNPLVNTTYSVTVTDGLGCTAEGSVDVILNTLPNVSATANPNPQCANEPVDLSATGGGGTSPYTYDWDNGLGAGQNHTVNPAANTTYTVTVSDDNGCTAETSVDVIVNQLPTVTATANPNPQCEGLPVDLSATGANGTGPYTYDWDNGLGAGQNHTVTPLVNTTYTVTVSDDNGCTAENSVDVVINEPPTITVTANPNPQCASEPVDLSASASGGTSPYTFAWDNGLGAGANHTVNPLVNTTYSVTVTDDLGCTAEGSVDVVLNTLPNVSATANPNPQCANEPVDLSATGGGGTGPYTYDWDNGLGAGQNHTVNPAANTTYTVTVSDDNGCTAETSVDVIVNQLPTVLATANPNPQCASEPVDLSATGSNGTGPYTYDWDNGLGAGQNHTVNPVGNTSYTVTVTDDNGCTNENTVNVVINEAPTVVVTETQQATCGSNNGEATATPSNGTSPYSYLWDNGDNSNDGIAENLNPGSISVVVTDDNGCTVSGSVSITTPSDIILTPIEVTPVTCFGGNDGVGNIDISGGTIPYDVTWTNGTTSGSNNGVGVGNFDITSLTAGTYIIEVTDAANCVETQTVDITQPNEITLNTNITVQLQCFGDSDAEAEITIAGGISNYDLTWDNGSVSGNLNGVDVGPHTITNLDAGTYTIVVTDANTCTASFSLDIIEPNEIVITPTMTTEPSCFGYNDGEGSVTIAGGTTNYDLTWDNGTTSGSLTNVDVGPHTLGSLDVGTYNILVTDANSCTQSTTLDITEPPVFGINLTLVQDVQCFGGTDGAFDIDLTGGTADFDITYDNGSTSGNLINVNAGPHNIINLDLGNYTVVATDANGCTINDNINLIEPTELLISSSMTLAVSCFGYTDGEADVTISGGTSDYDLTWDNGTTSGNSNAILAGTHSLNTLTAGTYTVVVTDDNGCTESSTLDITEPNEITNTINVTSQVDCNGGTTGGFDLLISGGTANYDIDWSNGTYSDNLVGVDVGPHNITNIPAGNYSLTITDGNTCEQIETFNITEPSIITITEDASSNVSCNAGTNGSIDITIGGGTPLYDLTWDNGSTSGALNNINAGAQSLTNLDAGDYLIEVTDDNGCVQSTNIIIDEPLTVLNLAVTSTVDASCIGVADGSAIVEATGGVAPYTFTWDHANGLDENLTNVTAGTYNVTVTDDWNCTLTIPVTIDQPANGLSTAVTTGDVSCPGSSDGSISLTPSGGTSPYTYNWDPNVSSNETASGLALGTYDITISDSGTCVETISVDIVLDPNALSLSFASTDSVSCFGGIDGSLEILATGGQPPYDYAWSNGPIIETTTGAAGNYTVSVTDDLGCMVTADSTIYEPNQLAGIILSYNDVNCFGGNDGDITVEASEGTPPYTYYWEDDAGSNMGITIPSASNLTAGTYYISITDDNGCGPVALSQIIGEPAAALSVTISEVNQPTCNGDSDGSVTTTAAGGTMPVATYQWEVPIAFFNGQTPAALENGDYEVTITDDNGCTATNTFTLLEPDVVTIDITVIEPSCNGDTDGSATAAGIGGNGGFTYHWENASGTTLSDLALLDNIGTGTYYVTATDILGCDIESSILVNEPNILSVNLTGVDPSTYGNNDGSATANPLGGTAPYTYEWEDQANPGTIVSTDQTALGLLTATYCVTVTDDRGCTVSDCIFLDQPPDQLAGVLATHDDISCFGFDDGTITINGYGGTPPYIFEWQDQLGTTIGTGPTISNLEPGNYYFTIMDQLAYDWDTMITIIEPSEFIYDNISNTDITCYNGSDAHVEVEAHGGTTPYSYAWENQLGPIATNNDTLYNVPAGDYSVTITDANGCGSHVATTTINQPPEYYITISLVSNPLCNGDSNGEITTAVTGGTPPYPTYAWDTPIDTYTGTNPNGLAADTYTVTVTDSNGCTTSDTYELTEPTAVDGVLSSTSTTGFGVSDGSVSVIASEGSPGYTYEWEDSANPGTIISTSDLVENLPAGNYCLTVYDINMCEFIDCIDIIEPEELLVTIDANNVDCNGNDNGTVDAIVTGGVPPYDFEWRNSGGILVSTNQSITGLVPDTYFVTVTDDNGYTATANVIITEPDIIISPVAVINHVTCFGLSNGGVTLNPSGGTMPYDITWYEENSPSVILSTNSILNNIPAGSYVFNLTDDNGCTHDTTIVITEPTEIIITSIETHNLPCPYDINTGWATVNFTGGSPAYTFIWTDDTMSDLGVNNDTITGLVPGDYNIEIQDVNGCPSANIDFSIDIPDAFDLSGTTDSVSCFDGTDGAIMLNVTGGTPLYTYSWTPDIGDTNNPTDLIPATYTVTVTDNNMCTAETSFTVGQPDAALSIASSQVDFIACYGEYTASLDLDLAGGTVPYNIYWENTEMVNGSFSSDIEGIVSIIDLAASDYDITITDSRNCEITDSYTITQPDDIEYSFIDIVEASCNGFSDASVSISATGGTGSLDYIWDDMATPVTHTNHSFIEAGWHYITITDDNLCQKFDSVFINQPDILTSNLLEELNVLCYGDSTAATSVTITGGTLEYDISWFNSIYVELGSDPWISNLPAGEYYFSVTDANLCEYVDTITVIQPEALSTVMDSIDPSCFEYQDGQIWVTVSGGTLGYNYSWDAPGAMNSDTAFSIPQGMWHVLVTDANMCTIQDSIEVVHPDDILIEDVTTHVDCSAFMGTSTLTVTGGTDPYEYEWTTSDETSFVMNLPGGEHSVVVTDNNECISYHTIDVPVEGGINVEITQSQHILCYGEHTAALQANVLGHHPYSFEWNNGLMVDTSYYENLPAGDYEVTVTDSWNCMGDTIYSVVQPNDIIITFTTQDVLCRNDSTGWISAEITGGTGAYSLGWQHNSSSDYSIYNLPVGAYYLQVTDGNECEAMNFVEIYEPDSSLFTNIGVVNTTCFASNDGQAFAQGLGGTPPYDYFWSGPYDHLIDTAVTSTNLFPGIYELTVTDAHACKYYTQALIGEPGPIEIEVSQYMGPSCLGNYDGYIALDSITGGTPPYLIRVAGEQVSWEQIGLLIDSLVGGTYHIDVIDSHNCVQYGNSVQITLIDNDIDCLQIPAAFSPNGDGYNDSWQIDNLHMFPKILIQIYNRWGQLLYEGGAFDNFWDGTYNGNVVPTGSYLYHIDVNINNLPPRVGTVTIIR